MSARTERHQLNFERNKWKDLVARGASSTIEPPRLISAVESNVAINSSAPVRQPETITALVQEDVRIEGVVFAFHERTMEETVAMRNAEVRASVRKTAYNLLDTLQAGEAKIVGAAQAVSNHVDAVVYDAELIAGALQLRFHTSDSTKPIRNATARIAEVADRVVSPINSALDTVLSLPVVARTTRAVGRYVGKVAPPVATGITVAACASGVGQEPTPIVIHVDKNGREIQPETTPTAVATQRPAQTAAAEQTQQPESTATPDAPSHGLNEKQENTMRTIRVRNSQGQDQGSLYDHFTSNDTSEEQRRTALGLVDLALTADQQVADPARIDAVEIARDPSLPDNVLNRDQIAFQVDGAGAPDASTNTLYLIVDNTIEVDGVNRSTYELIEMANNATNTQEKQRYIQLARQAGLLVYTPSEVGGQLRMAATPDGNRIMQRLDKDGNLVQETDKSALNWKVPLGAEKVFVAQGGENPFYTRENVNGGPAEAQSVYWDEDQRPLPPVDFDTSGFRLGEINGDVMYIDSTGNVKAKLTNRSDVSVGAWNQIVQQEVEREAKWYDNLTQEEMAAIVENSRRLLVAPNVPRSLEHIEISQDQDQNAQHIYVNGITLEKPSLINVAVNVPISRTPTDSEGGADYVYEQRIDEVYMLPVIIQNKQGRYAAVELILGAPDYTTAYGEFRHYTVSASRSGRIRPISEYVDQIPENEQIDFVMGTLYEHQKPFANNKLLDIQDDELKNTRLSRVPPLITFGPQTINFFEQWVDGNYVISEGEVPRLGVVSQIFLGVDVD